MEFRNVILAVVLSTLVIIGFHFFMSAQQKKNPTPAQQAVQTPQQQQVASAPQEKAKETSPTVEEMVPAQKITYTTRVRDIPVETSLYRALFTEAGARFKSFTLSKYRQTIDPDSPPVELVSSPKLGLPIEIYPTRAPGLAISPYRADKDSLKLDNGTQGELFFEPLVREPLTIEKDFDFTDGLYLMGLKVRVKNPGESQITDRLLFRLVSEPVAKLDRRYIFRGPAYCHEGNYEEVKLKKPGSFAEYTGELDWVGYGDPYFLVAMIPPKGEAWRATFRRLNEKAEEVILWSPEFVLAPGETQELELKLYFGPKDLEILKSTGYNLAKAVNFGFFDPIAKPLLYCLRFFYKYVHNYGVAIILLTALIRIIFWPLNHLSYKSMQKMRELQPIIMKLKEKYGDDKAKLNEELMRLYKTYKVNPFMGCLPMIIQIPVFFALYKVLLMAIELRHAPFFGWIKDLSAPDRLPIGIHIPYLDGIPVLTILMGISMYIQQKLSPTSLDPTQEKMMLLMPVVFTILFINFPSGLVLYWLTNNVLSIIQQLITNKMLERSKR
ncbi:MAG: membrane protein insertase YidC [Thermodesulfobacteria bacterium]|nr:membrane protein insertase YidC [Thermodesulfobacteriota bacterium]